MERIPMSLDVMPRIEPVVDGNVWMVFEDWHVSINGRSFVVPKGFVTDGASIPRLLWRICGHPMTTRRFPIALLHDWLYSEEGYKATGLTRKEADLIYYYGLRDLGFGVGSALVEYEMVRIFGGSHWEGRE